MATRAFRRVVENRIDPVGSAETMEIPFFKHWERAVE